MARLDGDGQIGRHSSVDSEGKTPDLFPLPPKLDVVPADGIVETRTDVGRQGALFDRAMNSKALGEQRRTIFRYEVSGNGHEPLALGDVTRYVNTLRVRGAEDYGRMSVALLVYRKNGSIVGVNGHVHVGDRRSTARIGEHAGVEGHLDEPSDPVVFHRQPRANERRRGCPKAQSSTWNIAEHVPPIEVTGSHAWSREGALPPDSRRFTARRRCASCEQ
jgi:hypothetical protein